ncbi:MAG: hypothetical protein JEZ14_21060 [Marinilabiliaceae bacterium]|nr:hypothetical protein [Marinilabiliaceae bacterium]
MDNTHNWGGDFALYIHQSKGIIDGNVAEIAALNSYALQHSSYDTFSPELYPWGWPILLIPVVSLIGLNYFWMKLYVLFFFLSMTYFAFRYFTTLTDKVTAIVVTLCLLVNTSFLMFTNSVLSEFPFLCFVFLSLWLFQNVKLVMEGVSCDTDNKSIMKRRLFLNVSVGELALLLFAAFSLFFTVAIRSEGYLLIVALLISASFDFINFSNKLLFIKQNSWQFVLWGTVALLHFVYLLLLPQGSGAHVGHFKLASIASMLENVEFYLFKIPLLFSSFFGDRFAFVILPLVYLGMIKRWTHDRTLVVFVLLLQGLLIIWPHQTMRYLFVQIPFIFYFLMRGLEMISFSLNIKGYKVSMAKLFFVFLIVCLSIDAAMIIPSQLADDKTTEGPETPAAKAMFEFIQDETGNDAVIVFFKPRVMSLYTKRKSCLVNDYPYKIRAEGDYLVIHKEMGNFDQIGSIHYNPPEWLDIKYENDLFIVYQIMKKLTV